MTLSAAMGLFLQGLAFFVLSLTVAFLQYRSQRILLAQRLPWLGVFALCEATVAWNDLLAATLPGRMLLPPFLRVAVLAAGYAMLLAFGGQTLLSKYAPSVHPQKLLVGAQLLWLLPYGVTLVAWFPAVNAPATTWEVVARYALAFPGGMLTGLGLRRQSYETLEPEWRQRIRPSLRLIEATALAFGLANLVLVPPATFFPARWLNQTWLPFPPALAWALIGLGLLLGLVRSLTYIQKEIERWIESVEQLQALSMDRERISRELHDGIIQSIYAAGLMLESIQHTIPHNPQQAQAQLARVMESLNQTIQELRRYIFDLRSDLPDETLEAGIRRLLRDFHINTLLNTSIDITGESPGRISLERRRHIFQIVRESLTNTARHAQARSVVVHLHYEPELLNLTLADDGVGMETLQVSKGYGLRNIRERVRLLDGTLHIESVPEIGTTLHLTVPLT